MTGQELIDWIKENHAEDLELVLRHAIYPMITTELDLITGESKKVIVV